MKEEDLEASIKIPDLVQVIAVAIGLLTSAILVAGYTWYIGYISAFGLDASFMNRGLGDVIAESWYVGLLALLYLLPFWWYPFAFVAIVGALMLGALYYVTHQQARGRDPLGRLITKQNQGRRILGFTQWHWMCWFQAIFEMAGWAIVPITVLILAFSVVATPFSEGNKSAKTDIQKYQEDGCTIDSAATSFEKCIALIDISSPSEPIAYGLLVSGSPERIAIFSEKGLQVWPLTSSYRIDKSYMTMPAESVDPY